MTNTENETPREEWLEKRRKYIGASDVATILGLNKWKDPYTLWAEKLGKLEPFPGNLRTRMGLEKEDIIARLFTEETGIPVRNPGDTYVVMSEIPYIGCTPDRLVDAELPSSPHHEFNGDPVELKNVGYWGGIDGWDRDSGECPLAYRAQLQIQMLCLGTTNGWLCGLIDDAELCISQWARDDDFLAWTLEQLARFWDHLVEETPPPVDFSPTSMVTFRALHPEDSSEVIQLPREAIEVIKRWEDAKARAKLVTAEVERAKNELTVMMGKNTFGEVDGVRLSLKTTERAGYTVKPSKYRTLRQVKVKG